jgi:hypothetical protein
MLLDMRIIRKLKNNLFSFFLQNHIFSYGQPPQGYPPYSGAYPDDGYGVNRNRASGYNPLHQQSGPVTTTQVTIPTEMAGKY